MRKTITMCQSIIFTGGSHIVYLMLWVTKLLVLLINNMWGKRHKAFTFLMRSACLLTRSACFSLSRVKCIWAVWALPRKHENERFHSYYHSKDWKKPLMLIKAALIINTVMLFCFKLTGFFSNVIYSCDQSWIMWWKQLRYLIFCGKHDIFLFRILEKHSIYLK